MSRLLCWLRGHRFEQRLLPEGNVHYHGGLRNDDGEALTWPTCRRCGRMIVTEVPNSRDDYDSIPCVCASPPPHEPGCLRFRAFKRAELERSRG
jgi:hypothetical protein